MNLNEEHLHGNPVTDILRNKPQLHSLTDKMLPVTQYAISLSRFFSDSILFEPPTLCPSPHSHPQKTQILGTALGTTAKSPKTDFLQKHSNLVCTTNFGVNNTILVFN